MRPKDVTMRLPFIRILLTYCASTVVGKSNQGKRKRLITCGAPYASSGFIYTHPVNSTASELGWSPDHYLTIHSAVSQPYLKELPSPNLWRRSRSFVGSQTLEKSSADAFTAAFPRQICFTNRNASDGEAQKLKRKENPPSTRRSTEQKVFVFRNVWEMTHSLTNVSLVRMRQTFVCVNVGEVIAWKNIFSF